MRANCALLGHFVTKITQPAIWLNIQRSNCHLVELSTIDDVELPYIILSPNHKIIHKSSDCD